MLRECEGDVKEVLRETSAWKPIFGHPTKFMDDVKWIYRSSVSDCGFFLRNGPSKEFWDDWIATGNVYRKGFTWGWPKWRWDTGWHRFSAVEPAPVTDSTFWHLWVFRTWIFCRGCEWVEPWLLHEHTGVCQGKYLVHPAIEGVFLIRSPLRPGLVLQICFAS